MRWGSQNHNFSLELGMMELKAVSSVYLKWGGRSSKLCSFLPEAFIMRIREQSEHTITNELQNTACQVEESRKEAVWRSDCFSGILPAVSVISYFYTGILVLTAWVKVSGSSHAERIVSDSVEKKEILILLFSYLYLLCLMLKAAAEVLRDICFIQAIFKIAVKYREAWTGSPYKQGLLFHSMNFTLLWRDGWMYQESSLESNWPWAMSSLVWKATDFYKAALGRVRDLALGLAVDTLCYNDICQWQRRKT